MTDERDDFGALRHRILTEIRRELARHPAVESVQGVPSGPQRELRATLRPGAFDREVEEATLRVAWWPAPEGDPSFVFHYSDHTGFDCGFHREPNPHVDGATHYQERPAPDEDYRYESISVDAETPPRLCWELLDRLADRLADHDG
jgi:hypothetical protein